MAKFDKALAFKPLGYTSHKVSSLVIAGTKAKARKVAKRGLAEEKSTALGRGGKSENSGVKVREMAEA